MFIISYTKPDELVLTIHLYGNSKLEALGGHKVVPMMLNKFNLIFMYKVKNIFLVFDVLTKGNLHLNSKWSHEVTQILFSIPFYKELRWVC